MTPEKLAERFWYALYATSVPGANMRSWDQLDHRSKMRIIGAMADAMLEEREK
jgi:hypothetical protein